MDDTADNYNSAATKNDTSCDYGDIIIDPGDEDEEGGSLLPVPGFSLLAVSSMLVLLSLLRRRT